MKKKQRNRQKSQRKELKFQAKCFIHFSTYKQKQKTYREKWILIFFHLKGMYQQTWIFSRRNASNSKRNASSISPPISRNQKTCREKWILIFFFILRVCSSRHGFFPAEMLNILTEMVHPFLHR